MATVYMVFDLGTRSQCRP